MFESLFNKCSHEYKVVGEIPATTIYDGETYDVPCTFLECKNCGKRIILRESDYEYRDSFLGILNLWTKGQFEIDFEPFKDELFGHQYLHDNNEKYRGILLSLLKEISRFNFPMHDSENKLIVNNLKGIINNALTEKVADA